MGTIDRKDRKVRKGRKGQKGATSIKGAMMMLVEGETHKDPSIKMGTTCMRETLGITRQLLIIDQPEALETKGIPTGNDKKHFLKTSDQLSEMLGGNPGTVECSADLEAKTDPG